MRVEEVLQLKSLLPFHPFNNIKKIFIMIFKQFSEEDVVAGRTSRIASGFWPNGLTNWSQSWLEHNYFSLTQSATPSTCYGSSFYDVRKTMYYLDVYPSTTQTNNDDPYFSITYGHVGGDVGSGSFQVEVDNIKVNPTKAIYNQYKNLLLGSADADGLFSFKTGSGADTVSADDIFVINFSSYKMKNRIDEGIFEISFHGTNGTFTFRDDSPYQSQVQSVYNLVTGSTSQTLTSAQLKYDAIGLLYPSNGIVILNAQKLSNLVGLSTMSESLNAPANYNPSIRSTSEDPYGNKSNFYALWWSLQKAGEVSGKMVKVRKSEEVPSRHYFVRVKNRDFNYSNNPTFVYDGSDGIHAKGTIRNADFINDPRTYITTVGLYNENNELVAVSKLSRPAVKDFSSELLIQVKLDF